jgi:hypothetical protein
VSIRNTSFVFFLFVCEVLKTWISHSYVSIFRNSGFQNFTHELKENNVGVTDQQKNLTWTSLYSEVLVVIISLWSVLSSPRYSKNERGSIFSDHPVIAITFYSAKSRQRPDQFQFLKYQKNSYPLENKSENFQLNWCIS